MNNKGNILIYVFLRNVLFLLELVSQLLHFKGTQFNRRSIRQVAFLCSGTKTGEFANSPLITGTDVVVEKVLSRSREGEVQRCTRYTLPTKSLHVEN